MSDTENRVLEYIRTEIPGLEAHLVGTRDFALEIAGKWFKDMEKEKIVFAALCHDLARLVDPSDIVSELKSRGIDPDSVGFVTPILLHGFLSAEIAKEKFGVDDGEILDAVRWHATGRDDMTDLEKIIYVADKIEETRDYPGVEELRNVVVEDFQTGFQRVVASVIEYVVARSQPLDYNSVDAWNRAIRDSDLRSGGLRK